MPKLSGLIQELIELRMIQLQVERYTISFGGKHRGEWIIGKRGRRDYDVVSLTVSRLRGAFVATSQRPGHRREEYTEPEGVDITGLTGLKGLNRTANK
jgi:hypothetical protein